MVYGRRLLRRAVESKYRNRRRSLPLCRRCGCWDRRSTATSLPRDRTGFTSSTSTPRTSESCSTGSGAAVGEMRRGTGTAGAGDLRGQSAAGRRTAPATAELAEFGFSLEAFGERTYLVRAVPAVLKDHDWRGMLRELLDGGSRDSRSEEAIIATIACHAAVRAGKPQRQRNARTGATAGADR